MDDSIWRLTVTLPEPLASLGLRQRGGACGTDQEVETVSIASAHRLAEEEEEGVSDANVAQRRFSVSAVQFNGWYHLRYVMCHKLQ